MSVSIHVKGQNMHQRTANFIKYSIFAVAILSLSGCAATGFGGPFNSKPAQIADISDKGNFTATSALKEARAQFKSNNFGYSAAYYKKYTELSPQSPQGYVGLAASYDRLGRFDLSDRVYASMRRITGETAQYYNNMGYSYMLRGNLQVALANFRKAAAIDPSNVTIANNIQLLADAASERA